MANNKKQDKSFDQLIEEFYRFLKYKLNFDDFQAFTSIISLFLLPISFLLGIYPIYNVIYVVIFIGVIGLDIGLIVYSILKLKRNKRSEKKEQKINIVQIAKIHNIDVVDQLSGVDFERFIEKIYKDKGYKTEITKASHDGGADIIAEKGRDSICIQAKRRKKPIRKQAVYEAYFARKKYSVNRACIATNNVLTEQALNFANDYNIEVIDRYKILAIMRNKK